jgi:hypothetical protein
MPRGALKVLCREIVPTDIGALAELLTRGFPGRNRSYWLRGLHRQSEREIPANYPRYGYLLEHDGMPVGVLLLLYAARHDGDEIAVRCNVSSWYVEPQFRNYATLLTSRAQKNADVTYINISPAANTWPIIEAQGFRRYCRGVMFSLPMLSAGERGATVETVTPDSPEIAHLPTADMELLRSHAGYGCLALVCHTGDGPLPFVLVPKRLKHGRFPFPAMQLVYCRDIAEFVRSAGAIGRYLLWRGRPVVIVDANAPVPGLVGIYTETRGRKYFKGPNPPRLADLAETELVLYGP